MNQTWLPITGGTCAIVYNSARIRDNNEIPTATRLFTGPNNMVGLVRIPSDVVKTGKSKVAAIYRKYMSNIVYPNLNTI